MHWIVVLLSFSAIIIIHELGHFLTARKIGVKVERFSVGFGPVLFKIKRFDTEFVISLIPLGGYVKMAGEDITDKVTGAAHEFGSRSIFERFLIIASGAIFNIISAFIVLSLLFMLGGTSIPSQSCAVGYVMEDYPAKAAGIKKDDLIIAIDDRKVTTWSEVTSIIHKNEGTPLLLQIERESELLRVEVTPKTESRKDIFGRDIRMSLIGIAPHMIEKKYNPPAAFYMGLKETGRWMGKLYKGLWLIITHQISLKNVAGPIGIINMSGQAAKTGMAALFGLMAVISVNLAVVNLLPFPILDGGHILFLILEKFRGKPLRQKTQEIVTQIAFYLLITLILLVSYNDLLRVGVFKKISGLWK
ncbi:MAG: RIP metalloprotease RseP [Candidatus Omnitrophota bacterium]